MLSVLRGAGLLKAALGLTGLIAAMAGAGAEELIIGVVGPQSGPGAVFGVDQSRAAELATKIANSKGGILGRTVKVIARDSQNESTMATTQAFRDWPATMPILWSALPRAPCATRSALSRSNSTFSIRPV